MDELVKLVQRLADVVTKQEKRLKTLEHDACISRDELVYCARALFSEDGESNLEYDRALVELVRDLTPFNRAEVARMMRNPQ